ncbi:hypothetical protein ADL00_10970 [Streptomyces sp. AS58]|uniref:hypothetical protein n=1 Tax=Streptomyces sp. AS58 TaxID=1519489 RepID=UPI0006B007E9|nr:hypothetical protein [Streptomyces sp. AS58]KOV69494.1 hypothetical protein ADL00_10970 [Streptomyces sp. AS58]
MSWLAPDTFLTFCRGMDLSTLTGILSEVQRPARSSGSSAGWSWVTHDAYAAPRGQGARDLARDITGHRYAGRAAQPDRVETVFLASTPACACPYGRDHQVPHCDEHPFQFAYHRGGLEQTFFNFGRRRESQRGGAAADLLVRELLDAAIVGRDAPDPGAGPDRNDDGAHTVRIIAAHFGLPSPPLHLPSL